VYYCEEDRRRGTSTSLFFLGKQRPAHSCTLVARFCSCIERSSHLGRNRNGAQQFPNQREPRKAQSLSNAVPEQAHSATIQSSVVPRSIQLSTRCQNLLVPERLRKRTAIWQAPSKRNSPKSTLDTGHQCKPQDSKTKTSDSCLSPQLCGCRIRAAGHWVQQKSKRTPTIIWKAPVLVVRI
jgi:hypothetical protein